MVFTSFNFILFIFSSLMFFWSVPPQWRAKAIIPLSNVLFLIAFIPFNHLFYLAGFVLYGYIVTHLCQRYKTHLLFFTTAIFTIFLFLYLRQYQFLSFLPYPDNFPFIIGLSYLFFRVMQIVIDTSNGDIKETPSFVQYLNFTCNFLMILSGPIQRYQDYLSQEQNIQKNKPISENDTLHSIIRVLFGYLKAGPLSAFFLKIHEKFFTHFEEVLFLDPLIGSILLGLTASFYLIFLYINFSGYTDIVIGLGRLYGFDLPENFNKPFSADNFIEFWQRWHISLANWMKFYVFNPTMKFLARHIKNPQVAPYISVVAFFFTFLLLGAWHGPTLPFLLCGIMLGLGMAVNKLYQVNCKKELGKKKFKAIQEIWLYKQLCFGLTFTWITFSIVGFWADWDKISTITTNAGVSGLWLSFLFTIIFSALVRPIVFLALKPVNIISRIVEKCNNNIFYYAYAAILLLSLYFYHEFFSVDVVEFIYEGF